MEMPYWNSTKSVICVFTIAFFLGCIFTSPQDSNNKNSNNPNFAAAYSTPEIIGKIESPEITESSGIVASRCNKDIFWTHNDSGKGAFIFAIDEKGTRLGTWRIAAAKNRDWEDIATYKDSAGECFLFVGDIGNNARLQTNLKVIRVPEPEVSENNSTKKKPLETEKPKEINFGYSDGPHDSETLLVHPKTGDIYVVTKSLIGSASVYKIAADDKAEFIFTLKKIADVSVPAFPNGFLTGGDISPDGKRLVICDYFSAYELTLPDNARDFDEIWKSEVTRIDLGPRDQGEAICYSADGNSIFATSEKKNSPIIRVNRKVDQ